MSRGSAVLLSLLAGLALAALTGAASGAPLPAAERRTLDTFFSNFSEAGMASFTPATLSDEALVAFALRHNYINNFKALKPGADNLSVLVTADQVDRTTEKYFGRTLGAHRGAPYALPLADGDPTPFSQIRTLTPRGEAGQYQAEGVIYTPGGPDAIDIHATPAAWKKQGEEVTETGRFTALIEKVRGGGGERWVLREYLVRPTGTH